MQYATPADRARCRDLIRTGSKSFHAASLLLPRPLRDPAYAVYGFCRLADDDVDLEGDRHAALERLRRRLDDLYAGRPWDIAVDRALADVVRRFAMPKALFEALLDGFAWDLEGRRYDTLEALQDYAARVAGSVGAIMTLLMGRREPDTVARACDLGIAMQLTNIARDVGEDARAGRVYLPITWLREEGIDPEAFLAEPGHSPAMGRLIARLLKAADMLYARSETGLAELPLGCRPAINAARRLYAEIGREVERQGHDGISHRAVVAPGRKIAVAMRAAMEAPMLARADHAPVLPAARFLVVAVESIPGPAWPLHPLVARASLDRLDRGFGRMLEILMELERRERGERGAALYGGEGAGMGGA